MEDKIWDMIAYTRDQDKVRWVSHMAAWRIQYLARASNTNRNDMYHDAGPL